MIDTDGGGEMAEDDEIGPVDYLVVEFPGNKMTGEGFPILLDLVDRGIIRILDLMFVRKDADGSVSVLQIADFAVFEGASSGLLGDDDLADAASVIEPNSSAGVLIYENAWAAPFAAALRRGGAELVASGRVSAADLVSSLGDA